MSEITRPAPTRTHAREAGGWCRCAPCAHGAGHQPAGGVGDCAVPVIPHIGTTVVLKGLK